MIEFGNSLRTARENKGFTIGQIAEMTRMAPTTIRDLESENFTRIAAPIYGRGFVKLYCEAVGLDPKPFVNEFMEIFNGNREPDIRERPVKGASEPAAPQPVEEPAPIDAPPPVAPPPMAAEPAPPPPEPEPQLEPEPETDLFHQPMADKPDAPSPEEPSLSRYAAPIRQAQPAIDTRSYLRLGLLGIGALALLALLICGIRAVYRATTPAEEEPAPAPETRADQQERKSAPVQEKTTRTPQKIPSLYID